MEKQVEQLVEQINLVSNRYLTAIKFVHDNIISYQEFEDKPLPSPSELKWQDVRHILQGPVPREQSIPNLQAVPLSNTLQIYMELADKYLNNTTDT